MRTNLNVLYACICRHEYKNEVKSSNEKIKKSRAHAIYAFRFVALFYAFTLANFDVKNANFAKMMKPEPKKKIVANVQRQIRIIERQRYERQRERREWEAQKKRKKLTTSIMYDDRCCYFHHYHPINFCLRIASRIRRSIRAKKKNIVWDTIWSFQFSLLWLHLFSCAYRLFHSLIFVLFLFSNILFCCFISFLLFRIIFQIIILIADHFSILTVSRFLFFDYFALIKKHLYSNIVNGL